MDAYHLPRALGPSCYWLWRPWVPGTMRDWTPAMWISRVHNEWVAKGRHPFNGIQMLNEPNLNAESGYPEGSREAAEATVAWGLEAVDLIRAAWPYCDIHSPPLSPNVPGWMDFYGWLEELIDASDYLNLHTYLDLPRSYEIPRALYPGWPLAISECGDRGNGSREYALRLIDWWDDLPEYVEWAAAFVYNDTAGQFPEWELHGTKAEQALIEAGE